MSMSGNHAAQHRHNRPGPFTVLPKYSLVLAGPGASHHRTFSRPVLLVIVLLILAALACSIESTTVHINNPRLYKEPTREASATRNFSRTDTIYCIVDVKDIEDDPVTVRIVWYQVVEDEATGEAEIEIARQQFIVTHNQELIFPRTPPATMPDQQWERGAYRFKMWLDDDHDATMDFKVR